jgi:hypothetical protein
MLCPDQDRTINSIRVLVKKGDEGAGVISGLNLHSFAFLCDHFALFAVPVFRLTAKNAKDAQRVAKANRISAKLRHPLIS